MNYNWLTRLFHPLKLNESYLQGLLKYMSAAKNVTGEFVFRILCYWKANELLCYVHKVAISLIATCEMILQEQPLKSEHDRTLLQVLWCLTQHSITCSLHTSLGLPMNLLRAPVLPLGIIRNLCCFMYLNSYASRTSSYSDCVYDGGKWTCWGW